MSLDTDSEINLLLNKTRLKYIYKKKKSTNLSSEEATACFHLGTSIIKSQSPLISTKEKASSLSNGALLSVNLLPQIHSNAQAHVPMQKNRSEDYMKYNYFRDNQLQQKFHSTISLAFPAGKKNQNSKYLMSLKDR